MDLTMFLDGLGLTSYEKSAILYLAGVECADAQTVHAEANIPQGRIYSVLNELKEKGIVTLIPTSPKQYKIDSVKEALNCYLAQREAFLHEKTAQLNKLALSPRIQGKVKSVPSVSLYTGREEHLNAVLNLRNAARKELLQIAPLFVGSFATRKSLMEALRRKVAVKIIITNVTPKNKQQVRMAIRQGAQIRQLRDIKCFSLLIKDNSELLLGVHDDRKHEERMTLHTRNPALTATLRQAFLRLWKQADTLSKC